MGKKTARRPKDLKATKGRDVRGGKPPATSGRARSRSPTELVGSPAHPAAKSPVR